MEIVFFTNIPEDRESFDVSYSAEIYFSDDPDADPIYTKAEGVTFDEFKSEILAAVLASVLEAAGDTLVIDGETIDFGQDEDIVDEFFDALAEDAEYENEEND